jgi:hypothetical protein
MWLLILEASAAFCIFAFIIWWTMFSGRKPEYSEPPRKTASDAAKQEDNTDRNPDQDTDRQ